MPSHMAVNLLPCLTFLCHRMSASLLLTHWRPNSQASSRLTSASGAPQRAPLSLDILMAGRSYASPIPTRPSHSAMTRTWTTFASSPSATTHPLPCKILHWPDTLPKCPPLARRSTYLTGHLPPLGAPRLAFPSWSRTQHPLPILSSIYLPRLRRSIPWT
jgi:hypothetical protein